MAVANDLCATPWCLNKAKWHPELTDPLVYLTNSVKELFRNQSFALQRGHVL